MRSIELLFSIFKYIANLGFQVLSLGGCLTSILNWPGHELQWRGSSEPFEGRNEEVATMYQSKDLKKVKALLDKYQIRYVYLGSRERAKYNVEDPAMFSQLMKVYFQSSDVIVYERIVP